MLNKLTIIRIINIIDRTGISRTHAETVSMTLEEASLIFFMRLPAPPLNALKKALAEPASWFMSGGGGSYCGRWGLLVGGGVPETIAQLELETAQIWDYTFRGVVLRPLGTIGGWRSAWNNSTIRIRNSTNMGLHFQGGRTAAAGDYWWVEECLKQ